MGDSVKITAEQIKEYAMIWADELCKCAGESEIYAEAFKEKLLASPGVYSEYVYYMIYHKFACNYKVEEVSLVDIMIWQIDHFKADMDMGHNDMRDNGDKMLLMAFATMLEMEKDPVTIIGKMRSESGSDFPDKY